MQYFNQMDFVSSVAFEKALINLASTYGNWRNDIHEKRQEIANEIINFLREDKFLAAQIKIKLLNQAIVDPLFTSRNFGALKRGANSFLSGGKGPTDNINPYFRSDSQEMLIKERAQIAKDHGMRPEEVENYKVYHPK